MESLTEQKIRCPKCGESISIDTVLTRQIEEKIKNGLVVEQKAKELELKTKLAEIEKKEIEIKKAKESVDNLVAEKVADEIIKEKEQIIRASKLQASKEKETEVKILEEQLKEKDKKISEINAESLKLRLDRQKLESDRQEFELKLQRKLDEERKNIEYTAGKKAAEAEQYKIAQLEKKISDANKMNDDLKRKLEQGSQQTQGEVLELELEEILKREFLNDRILPVPKGVEGADLVQGVINSNGKLCGSIIWESKKTKAWSDNWIQKLKDDQRAARADVAVIVSTSLPNNICGFGLCSGIWICDKKYTVPLATAIRMNLEAINREKLMAVGKNEKMEILYSYLTGVEFKQRVEAIVEAFSSMKEGLEKEKLSYIKIWSQREKQIEKVLHNTIGMYGDLSGMVSLPSIKSLELPSGKTRRTRKF